MYPGEGRRKNQPKTKKQKKRKVPCDRGGDAANSGGNCIIYQEIVRSKKGFEA